MDDAQVRDCFVKVSWTGDADIDLTVQEPTGAVCTFSNPRTSGAESCRATPTQRSKRPAATVRPITRIVRFAQGFNGQYKVLVRRLWGQVATGKVTVDVYTHFGTTNEVHVRKQIPVSERDALVNFDLNGGRRTEPLEQAQLAIAAENQEAISRAVLSQQMSEIDNGSSLTDDSGNNNPPNAGDRSG